MEHPGVSELAEYLKDKISPGRAREIEQHLHLCDSCKLECKSLGELEEILTKWESPPVSREFLSEVIESIPVKNYEIPYPEYRMNPWLRRLALASGVLVITLLFQLFIWNPLPSSAEIEAVINMTTSAPAYTQEQTIPDTVLVITVYPNETFSVPFIPGQYGLVELIQKLSATVQSERYSEILLVGSDPDKRITVQLDQFEPLETALGIKKTHVGVGIDGLQSVNIIWQYNFLPDRQQDRPQARLLVDSLYVRIIEKMIVIQRQADQNSYNAWIKSRGIRATVLDNGHVLIDRASVEIDEFRQVLLELHNLNPNLSLSVFVREDRGPDDPGYQLAEIARQLGIRGVHVGRVKKP